MAIRSATTADVAELAKLFRMQAEHQQSLTHFFRLSPDADFDSLIATSITGETSAILVAELEGGLIGYLCICVVNEQPPARCGWRSLLRTLLRRQRRASQSLSEPRRYGLIEDWFVLSAHRGRGVGKRLLAAGEDWLRVRGVREIDATVWTGN